MRFRSRSVAFSRPVVALLVCACAICAQGVGVAPSAAQGEGADALLEAFAHMPGLYARFHEEKHVALLSVPLESDGEIYFAPPGRLMRKVTSPTPSSALLEGDRLTLVSPGERRQLDLGDNAVVRGFVGAFRDVLAGDRAALERSYRVVYHAEGEAFTLTLTPRRAELSRLLRTLTLRGTGRRLTSIHMVEANGDETTTTFSEVDAARRYSAAEQARIFRLPDAR